MQIFFIKLSADVKFLLNLFETKYHFNITKSSNSKQLIFLWLEQQIILVSVSFQSFSSQVQLLLGT